MAKANQKNLNSQNGYRPRRILTLRDPEPPEEAPAKSEPLSGGEKPGLKKLFQKSRFILFFALLVAAAAGFFGWRTLPKYTASLALTVSQSGGQPAIDYKYDSYYALQATDDFGDTVTGWFKTPEIASAINKKIKIDSSSWSLRDLRDEFSAAKLSPSVVEVRYGAQSQEKAKEIAAAVNEVISQKTELLNSSSKQAIAFAVIAGEPVIAKNSVNIFYNISAGFLIGLVFGFFIKTAREYFV